MYKRIYDWRKDEGISQKEMGERLNIHQTTYSDYERCELNMPVQVLCRIADMMQVSVDYLLERTDVTTPYPPKKK